MFKFGCVVQFCICINFLLFTNTTVFSQSRLIENINRTSIKTYQNPYPELNQIKIPTPYNQAIFDDALQGINFFEIDILAWDLVFTENPIGVNHDNLNERRLQWLQKRLPIAYNIDKQKMRVVEQNGAKTVEKAEKEFHGFALYYRLKPSAKLLTEELNFLDTLLKKNIEKTVTANNTNTLTWMPKKHVKGEFNDKTKHPLPCVAVNYYYTCYSKELKATFKKNFDAVEVVTLYELMKRSMLFNRNEYINCDSILIGYKCKKRDEIIKYVDTSRADIDALTKIKKDKTPNYRLRDSAVLNSFERKNWDNAIICLDVTASMSPYTAQLLIWLGNKTNTTQKNTFYFFNDGDSKKDAEKIIGSTGGIYKIQSNNFGDVVNAMTNAMRRGTGGDFPENNLECVLKAQSENATAKEIVMIADNWSNVKDMVLLPQIKIPVSIVVCGNIQFIQPNYLTIAYQTKGSIHTLRTDITDLYKLKNGDIFTYYNKNYKLENGSFVLMPQEPQKK